MKIENIRLFLEVVRYGSINKAAEHNFIAQQNLSTIIKNMETELGDKLLMRNNSGITLTDNGKNFYKCAQNIVSDYDKYWDSTHKGENNIIHIYSTLALSECLSDLQGCEFNDKYYSSLHGRGANEIKQMIEQKKEGIYFLAVMDDDIAKMKEGRECTLIAQENKTCFFCHNSSPLAKRYLEGGLNDEQMSEHMLVNLLSYDMTMESNMINVNSVSACKKLMREKGFYCSLPYSLKHILGFDDPEEWIELMEKDDVHIAYFLLCTAGSPQKYQNVHKYLAQTIQEKFQYR